MNAQETLKALERAASIQRQIARLQAEYAQVIASVSAPNGSTLASRRSHPQSEATKRKLRQIAAMRWKKAKAAGKTKL